MRERILAVLVVALLAIPTVLANSYTYERGYEYISVEPDSGYPLRTFVNITLADFPPSKTVEIYFGGVRVATVRTNSTGQAEVINLRLPELPGGYLLVTARVPDSGVVASDYFNVLPYIELLDGSNNPVLATTYLGDGDELRVRGFGFLPGEIITIEDDASVERNPISSGRVLDVFVGQLGPSYIVANEYGSFDLRYRLRVEVGTGDIVTVTVRGEGTNYDVGSGVFTSEFLAAGPVSIVLATTEYYMGEPGDEISIPVSSFRGLREDRRYQLMLDRSRLDITVDGVEASWFMPQNGTVSFTIPTLSPGVHSLSVVYYGSSTPLAEHLFVVSKPGTTAGIAIVATEGGVPMPQTVERLVPGGQYMLVAYNFESSETGVYAYMYTDTSPAYSLGRVSIWGHGAGIRSFTVPSMPSGVYSVYVTRTAEEPPDPVVFDLVPRAEIYPDDGSVGATAWLDIWGLKPNTGYVIIWDVLGSPLPLANTTFVTDDAGGKSNVDFEIPPVPAGTYAISVAPISDPTSPIQLYGLDGELSYPTFDVTSEVTFNPSGEYIPFQLVTFTWEIGRDPDNDFVVVELDGTPIYTGTLNPDSVQATGTSTVYWSNGVIKGSFVMPNGEPKDIIFRIRAGEDEAVGVLKRVSGAGAFLEGTDLENDIAYIKTKTGEVAASLSDLDARVEKIEGDVVYIRTNIGTVTSTLDAVNAVLDSITGEMALVRTDLGDIKVSLDNIASLVSAVPEEIIPKVEEGLNEVSSSISEVRTMVSGVSDDLADVGAGVTGVSSQVSALDGKVDTVTTQLTELINYVYMIITLLAIAIILSIVILLRRK